MQFKWVCKNSGSKNNSQKNNILMMNEIHFEKKKIFPHNDVDSDGKKKSHFTLILPINYTSNFQ